MSMIYHRTCTVCGTAFTCTHEKRRRTCSDECIKASYVGRLDHRRKRTEFTCQHCGKTFTERECRARKYCSRACKHLAQSGPRPLRTSAVKPCDYCGKPVRKFKSREYHKHTFCNEKCYHDWDSWYKSQPAQRHKHTARMLQLAASKTSQVEDDVARWLDEHSIAYERQVSIIHKSMDFKVGDAFIEVQGCYWHGCPYCYILQTPKQRKVMSRDKAKATYCRRRNIPLYVIWEHDVRAGNFSALEPLTLPGA